MSVPGFNSDERILYTNLWRVLSKMYGGRGTIASKEIDCADRIVHETGIHKAIVDSSKESDCFLNILRVKIVLINSDIAI